MAEPVPMTPQGAQKLRDDVGGRLSGIKPASGDKPERDGWIEMASGNVSDGVGHDQD